MSIIDELIEDGYLRPPIGAHFVIKLVGERWSLYEHMRDGWTVIFSNSNKEIVRSLMHDQAHTHFFNSDAKPL